MKISRSWAMPNKWTFKIKPIRELLQKYVKTGKGWIDPMSGFNSPAKNTNDENHKTPAEFHMDALKFLKYFKTGSVKGVIFDPPYSYEKAVRLYKKKYPHTQVLYNYLTSCKREIIRITKPGGIVIMFGWNSTGLGAKNGFELLEVLIVPHGWLCNDTIVTVEKKLEIKA